MRVAFSGFLTDGSGYGEAARRLVAALMMRDDVDVGIGILLRDGGWQVEPTPLLRAFLQHQLSGPADVHVIHCAAMDFDKIRPDFMTARRVGMTCWETDRLHPLALEGTKAVDRVLVPSRHNQLVFEDAGVPVDVVPYPIAVPPYLDERDIPAWDNLVASGISPDTFVFYTVATFQDRKNVVGLLQAFFHAFTAEDNVALLLKVGGQDPKTAMAHAQAVVMGVARAMCTKGKDFKSTDDLPRVRLLGGNWTETQLWGLHARGDCYVSLARGEAYGLPILDAASLGNRVITTAWGGQMDFVPLETTHCIPFELTPVMQDYPHFSGRQLWAEPHILRAAQRMRQCVAEGRRAKEVTEFAHLSPLSVGQLFVETLMEALN